MADFIYRVDPWIRTLVAHNWPVMVLFPLILWSAVRAYLLSNRPALLLLYGFVLLAGTFEYQKHGVPVLRGTTDYLFEIRPALRASVQFILLDAFPPALYLLGSVFVLLGVKPGGFTNPQPSDAESPHEANL